MSYRNPCKVNYYDCDSSNLLRLSAAMRYMQQTSSEHLESRGISTERLYTEGMVFLLTKMNIKIHRMPVCNERITVSTAFVAVRGVRFHREFTIDSAEGERLVSALSLWVLVDPQNHKILRPAAFRHSMDPEDSMIGGAIGDCAIPKPVAAAQETTSTVDIRYSHLDVNRHVNNSIYGDFLCDAVPYDALVQRGLDTAVIHFQNEATWGEKLEIITHQMESGAYHVLGRHADGAACFEAYAVLGE